VRGEVAIASAKLAYQIYKELFRSERFEKLAALGARSQRLLWASTSTKNPNYDDLKYVESLVGPETINTVTVETLDAYRDHGEPKGRLEEDLAKARLVLEQLPALGIDLGSVTAQLEHEGIEKFNKAFDRLMSALSEEIVLAV
jgi:transaldolase